MLESSTGNMKWNGTTWTHSGSIAFAVEEEFRESIQPLTDAVTSPIPEIFSECSKEGLTASYGGLIKLLVETVKTQQDQINTLTKQIGVNND